MDWFKGGGRGEGVGDYEVWRGLMRKSAGMRSSSAEEGSGMRVNEPVDIL